jgi:hypothetical protein
MRGIGESLPLQLDLIAVALLFDLACRFCGDNALGSLTPGILKAFSHYRIVVRPTDPRTALLAERGG